MLRWSAAVARPSDPPDASANDSTDDASAAAAPPTEVRASHILIPFKGASRAPDTVSRSKEDAKKEAERILALVRKAPANFENLAREHSSCSSSTKGGDLGSFGRGRMAKPFEESAFGLRVSEVSEVVETDFGYHIIKRTE